MKKLMVVAVVVLAVFAMAGCHSGGGSTSAVPAVSSNAASGTAGSNGGSITMPDGAIISIDPGVVIDNTTLAIAGYANSAYPAGNATAISPTYALQVSKDNLLALANDDSDFANGIAIAIPSTKLSKASAIKNAPSANDVYKLSRVVIDNGAEKLVLFGRYVISNGQAVIKVSRSSLVKAAQTANTDKLTVTMENFDTTCYANAHSTACLADPVHTDVPTTLYSVSKSAGGFSFNAVSAVATTAKTPIILIHGWQLFNGLTHLQLGDTTALEPEKETWNNFISYFYAQLLDQYFDLYTLRYDSDHSIESSASELAAKIGSSKVVLIAHSMGGLVSHFYIQAYGGDANVIKLITLGTPFHGTPMIQLLGSGAVAHSPLAALARVTPGTLELAWDNYDSNAKITTGNPMLLNINSVGKNLDAYKAFGGDISSNISAHDIKYRAGFDTIGIAYGYPTDGIVPTVSSSFDGHISGQATMMYDYDHTQLSKEKADSIALFGEIRDELLALKNAPPAGLIGHWKMDEISGDSLVDSSGNGNTAFATGTTVIGGKLGNARKGGITGNYINIPSAPLPATNITVLMWVNIYDTPVGGNLYFHGPQSGCNPSVAGLNLYNLQLSHSVGCGAGGGAPSNLLSSGSLLLNTWHMVGYTTDSSNLTTLYIDGVAQNTPTDNTGGQSLGTGNDVIGGSWSGGSFSSAMGYVVDEVRIYNRVLTSAEILDLYNNP